MSTQSLVPPGKTASHYPQTLNLNRNALIQPNTTFTDQPHQRNYRKPSIGISHGNMKKFSLWNAGQDEILMIMYQVLEELTTKYPSNKPLPLGILTPENLNVDTLPGKSEDDGAFISSINDPILPKPEHKYYTPPERKDSLNNSPANQNPYEELPNPGKDIVWSLGACLSQLIVGLEIEDIRDAKPNQILDIDKIVSKMIKKIGNRSMDQVWLENLRLVRFMLDSNRETRPDVQDVFQEVKKMVNLRIGQKSQNIFKNELYLFRPVSDCRQIKHSVEIGGSRIEDKPIIQTKVDMPKASFRMNVFECKLMMDVCSLLHNLWGYYRVEHLQNLIAAAYNQILALIDQIQIAPEWEDGAERQTRYKIEDIRSQTSKFEFHLHNLRCKPIFFSNLLLLSDVYAQYLRIFEQNDYRHLLHAEFVRSKNFEEVMQQLKKKTAQAIMILALLGKQDLDDEELSLADEMKILQEIIVSPVQLMERKKSLLNELYFGVLHSKN